MSDLEERESRFEDLIGSDRDAARLVDALLAGTSVVVVGALGSGKSHLLKVVAAQLRAAGAEPALVRSGGPLADATFGALDAAHDPRIDRIRDGASPSAPFIIVVDDAHDLDDASASALVRAVYRGAATVLLGLTVDRERDPHIGPQTGAAHMAIDLWLRGLAERVDLAELSPVDAEGLLESFGGSGFDSLTAAAVVGLADGSRMLLRELTREAVLAIDQGRDPLAAIRDAPHGRLLDAVAAHVDQLPAAERSTLAVLGRLPRVAFAHATRIVDARTLEALVASRLVYDDGTPERRLTANAVLARQAEHASAAMEVDGVVARAAEEMLAEDAAWWSAPLAQLIALAWHRGDRALPTPDSVSEDTLLRVAMDGAVAANDEGDPDLAASLAELGLATREELPLRLELAYADAARGRAVDVEALLARFDRSVGHEALLRWLRMVPLLPGGNADGRRRRAFELLSATEDDTATSTELALMAAEVTSLQADWSSATEQAEAVIARPMSTSTQRLRAAVVAGLSQASLGDAAAVRHWFLRAERFGRERGGPSVASGTERLWALHSEVFAHSMCGIDARPALARLSEEYVAGTFAGEMNVIASAGFVAASSWAMVGDADRAIIELRAALRRPLSPIMASMVALVEIIVARALAYRGRVEEAREILDAVDPAMVDGVPLGRHARMMTESVVLSAEGDCSAARQMAREAVTISASSPTMLSRDLFQLVALGDEEQAHLGRMRSIAAETTVPVTRQLYDRAVELVENGKTAPRITAIEALRRSAVWGVGDISRNGDRSTGRSNGVSGSGHVPTSGDPADGELTRREREIALLVAEGLSNREIATHLFLSIRTVESHIYQARAKVSAASRGELGRFVAQRKRATTASAAITSASRAAG